MKFEPVVSSCAFRLKSKVLCDILISHEIQGSHNHIHFIEHFIKWLQLHRISHYFATAAAVRATAEAAPKGRDSPVPTRSKAAGRHRRATDGARRRSPAPVARDGDSRRRRGIGDGRNSTRSPGIGAGEPREGDGGGGRFLGAAP